MSGYEKEKFEMDVDCPDEEIHQDRTKQLEIRKNNILKPSRFKVRKNFDYTKYMNPDLPVGYPIKHPRLVYEYGGYDYEGEHYFLADYIDRSGVDFKPEYQHLGDFELELSDDDTTEGNKENGDSEKKYEEDGEENDDVVPGDYDKAEGREDGEKDVDVVPDDYEGEKENGESEEKYEDGEENDDVVPDDYNEADGGEDGEKDVDVVPDDYDEADGGEDGEKDVNVVSDDYDECNEDGADEEDEEEKA